MIDIKDVANSSELILLPICYIGWISQNEPEPSLDIVVKTPIYHNLDREKLLCTINVPNTGEASARIIGGVALFLTGSEWEIYLYL